eukprot:TRINITY_DN24216_c0_g1_i1.p1 TRINITY_DN24216_c0_g1~~TRINITY_DN24216_c0_g1_i1.p1  ORF type:complete len:388 (+),score=76.42 TRINITY_DN24216_c0_g1_i1:99-1166(+)
MKSLTTAPDHIVMRQLGIFRARRFRLVLGMLAELSLYTDLTFVLLARDCDDSLTARWAETWLRVPFVGTHLSALVQQVRLWGIAAMLAATNVLFFGAGGLLRMARELHESSQGIHASTPKWPSGSFLGPTDGPDTEVDAERAVSGVAYFAWARSAEVAFMPSVATFCAEMGAQRRFVYDEHGDGRLAAKARAELLLGRNSKENVILTEQVVHEQWERVDASERRYFLGMLLGKVLLLTSMQVWLQASYFALTFGDTGTKAKYKVMVGIALSGLQLLVRCAEAPARLGFSGAMLCTCVFFFLLAALAKVIFAFRCPEHLWNVTTGCVSDAAAVTPAAATAVSEAAASLVSATAAGG